MKIFISFIFILILPLACPAQQNIPKYGTMKPFMGMKGNVKILTEETYSRFYDRNLEETWVPGKKIILEFDRNGYVKKETTFSDLENTMDKKIIVYDRDKNGRAVRTYQETHYSLHPLEKSKTSLYVVDEKKEYIVSWKKYNTEYASVDTTYIHYISDAVVRFSDTNGRKEEIREHYDVNGNMVQEKKLVFGKVRVWYEQSYDKNNLLSERKYHKINPFDALHYSYGKFDAEGNWCEQIIRHTTDDNIEDLVVLMRVIRKIEYY